ncbi:putative NAC transcription factor 29-like [Cocos nucifera]|nr:putative NAC transcription factor 29-like [Cocos nucifera]
MGNRDSEWYFFTSTVRKHPDASDSSRASRRAGEGRWKATQRIKNVLDSDHNVLGSKQCFCYMERCPSGGETKTIWLMEEYSIHDLRRKAGSSAVSGSNKLDEWVICKIYLTPKARKAHMTGEDLHETQPVERAALEPKAKRRRMEEPQTMSSLYMHPNQDISGHCQTLQLPDDALPQLINVSGASIDGCSPTQHSSEEPSTPSQGIADSFKIHQPADGTFPHSDPAMPMPMAMMNSLCMHPSQDIAAHCQILQLVDDALPQLVDVLDAPIDGCSPTQHASEELSIPSRDIVDSFQIHQLAGNTLPHSDPVMPVLLETMSSRCMPPSQDIADHCQILQLPDDALPQLIDVSDASTDGCSPAQHASEEASIPTQDIADSFQIHQPVDGTLSHYDPTAAMVVEMMEGLEHVFGQADLDQILKYIDAEDSNIACSPKIMQTHGEENEEIAALLGSFHDDPSMPSIDDIL